MQTEEQLAPIALRKADRDTVYFLYRYRAFTDENHSLRQILSENRWWFASRKGFDDKSDCVLGGAVLTPEHLQRRIRESGGSERDIEDPRSDPTTDVRVTTAVQEGAIDKIGIFA
jgi:hypothetical protein